MFTYTINQRPYTLSSSLSEELNFLLNKNYLFDLGYLSSLTISGERAKEFLQGQVTCDVREVTSSKIQQGAMCNLKGRLLVLFDVIDWDGLKLVLPYDLQTETQTSLAKTALLSHVQVKPGNNFKIFGFYLQNPDDIMPFKTPMPVNSLEMIQTEQVCCYALDDKRYVILVKPEAEKNMLELFPSAYRGSLAWHYLTLQASAFEIYPISRGLFLPHRLGLQDSGHINFNKGCYKGQEIIARTHYRAKLKHHFQTFVIKADEKLQAGQKILHPAEGIEIGELIDFTPIDDNRYLIACSVLFEHPSDVLFEGISHELKLI